MKTGYYVHVGLINKRELDTDALTFIRGVPLTTSDDLYMGFLALLLAMVARSRLRGDY